MKLYTHAVLLVLVPASYCLEVEMTGEVSFDLRISETAHQRAEEVKTESISKVTVGPEVECLYQYPDVEQFNAMLSNMMNELTKVFMRIHKMLVEKKHSRRRGGTRFTVVDKKNYPFFELIYANMTKEYTKFYTNTTTHVARTSKDPCQNQEQLKKVWQSLLEKSLTSLRRASLRCIEEYLHAQGRSNDNRTRYKLGQFLLHELGRVRVSQLHILCDHFQLCFNDLL